MIYNLLRICCFEEKVFESYKIAAEKGNKLAQNYLGVLYRNGEGTEKDLEKVPSGKNKMIDSLLPRIKGFSARVLKEQKREWYGGESYLILGSDIMTAGGKNRPSKLKLKSMKFNQLPLDIIRNNGFEFHSKVWSRNVVLKLWRPHAISIA